MGCSLRCFRSPSSQENPVDIQVPKMPPIRSEKIVIVGDSTTGKTSLMLRFTDELFSHNFISTIGVDFKRKNLQILKENIDLQIWDTAGQERYRTIYSPSFYINAKGIIVVFDLTNYQTFMNIHQWIILTQHQQYAKNHILYLVGNKCDLKNREVTREEAQELALEIGAYYVETSAKEATNVHDMFTSLVEKIILH